MENAAPKECEDATSNPRCPYASTIQELNTKMGRCQTDITEVKDALLGNLKDPSKPGLAIRIKNIEDSLKRRFSLKDLGQLLLGIAALVGALVALFT